MGSANDTTVRAEARRAAIDIIHSRPEIGGRRFLAFPHSGYVKALGRELRSLCNGTGMRFDLFSEGRIHTPDRGSKKGVMVTRTK